MSSSCAPTAVPPPEPFRSLQIATATAAGTPDLDADVLALSPRALLEPGHLFVCDVCGRRFHRFHNLYKHRRLHSASGKPPRSGEATAPKRFVFVCPERSCRRHDPSHAMANFAGIKRHFQKKHRNHKLWTCARCSGAFANYKDHLRTCGTQTQATRFVGHQDTCDASQPRSEKSLSPASGCGVGLGVAASRQLHEAAAATGTSASCGDLGVGTTATSGGGPNVVAASHQLDPVFSPLTPPDRPVVHDMELQFIPPRRSCAPPHTSAIIPQLELSLWFGGARGDSQASASVTAATARLKEEAREQRRLAMAQKAAAEEARAEARRQTQLAQHELAIARRVRQQAQAEFSSAHALRYDAVLLQGTCCSCRHKFNARAPTMSSEVASYVTSVVAEVDLNAGPGRAKPC